MFCAEREPFSLHPNCSHASMSAKEETVVFVFSAKYLFCIALRHSIFCVGNAKFI